MTTEFIALLRNRKEELVTELESINHLLDLHDREEPAHQAPIERPKGKRGGSFVTLPRGDKVRTVINIAKELHAKVRRPVTTSEIKRELTSRGYRAPRNGKGHEMISTYLTSQRQMRREGDGYVPAA